jgi:hypothetical protein
LYCLGAARSSCERAGGSAEQSLVARVSVHCVRKRAHQLRLAASAVLREQTARLESAASVRGEGAQHQQRSLARVVTVPKLQRLSAACERVQAKESKLRERSVCSKALEGAQ